MVETLTQWIPLLNAVIVFIAWPLWKFFRKTVISLQVSIANQDKQIKKLEALLASKDAEVGLLKEEIEVLRAIVLESLSPEQLKKHIKNLRFGNGQ